MIITRSCRSPRGTKVKLTVFRVGEPKNLEFEIVYRTEEKGEYLFDIIIQDRLAPGLSKYRSFLKRKV